MGCTDTSSNAPPPSPLGREVGTPDQCPLGSVASFFVHADVPLHIPMTHRNDRMECRTLRS